MSELTPETARAAADWIDAQELNDYDGWADNLRDEADRLDGLR